MQKTQFALTRPGGNGLEVGRAGFGVCAIGGGGSESLSDDGLTTMKRLRGMATNIATRPRGVLFDGLDGVLQDVPEHE